MKIENNEERDWRPIEIKKIDHQEITEDQKQKVIENMNQAILDYHAQRVVRLEGDPKPEKKS